MEVWRIHVEELYPVRPIQHARGEVGSVQRASRPPGQNRIVKLAEIVAMELIDPLVDEGEISGSEKQDKEGERDLNCGGDNWSEPVRVAMACSIARNSWRHFRATCPR